MTHTLHLAEGGTDPSTIEPIEHFRPSPEFDGVHHGLRRLYVIGAHPSILTQLRRCLRHYHARVKGHAYWGSTPVNWITGEQQPA